MTAGYDIILLSVGLLLLYSDIGYHYAVNRSLSGYLCSWKRDLKRLIS